MNDARGVRRTDDPQALDALAAAAREADRAKAALHTLHGWGRIGVRAREIVSEDLRAATRGAVLTRGLGRSYGDASLPPPGRPEVVSSVRADRILAFDARTGAVRAEAGLSLETLNRLYLRRGWFTPVTPGTQYVTLGGMVAADVHGKNHHVDGCFGAHVRSILLRTGRGELVECSPAHEPALFDATLGGMGLTGHILEVAFAMKPVPSPWILAESVRVRDIDAYLTALADAAANWPYTVGWIDCLSRGRDLGRGILIRGRFATAGEAPRASPPPLRRIAVPFVCPDFVLGRTTVRAFNALYYGKHRDRTRAGVEHPETFFYPLDAVLHWNRLYGRRGFTQYQCVLPRAAGSDAARRFLEVLSARGGTSFLCVIKDCGAEGRGTLSFPMPGISIACDIPVRSDTQQLVDALNECVLRLGGRVYLAKDQFTRADHFRAMEPRLPRFLEERERWDPDRTIRSALSVRLFGDPP